MKINLEDIDAFDILKMEREKEASGCEDEVNNEWDSHGFKDQEDYWNWKEG